MCFVYASSLNFELDKRDTCLKCYQFFHSRLLSLTILLSFCAPKKQKKKKSCSQISIKYLQHHQRKVRDFSLFAWLFSVWRFYSFQQSRTVASFFGTVSIAVFISIIFYTRVTFMRMPDQTLPPEIISMESSEIFVIENLAYRHFWNCLTMGAVFVPIVYLLWQVS